MSQPGRNALIAGGVVLLHVAALWALQSGLLRRAVEVVVPVELLSSIVTPPQPPAPPAPAPTPPAPAPVVREQPAPRKQVVRPAPAPAPLPVAAPEPAPAPAPQPTATATAEPQPAPPPIQAPVATAPAPAPAPRVELPIANADYLQNPVPPWPRLSQRLGERGLVQVRVLIGADGRAKKAEVAKSSGFPRLDQASVDAVLNWRYVPGKRGGVPEEMWFVVPIRWGD